MASEAKTGRSVVEAEVGVGEAVFLFLFCLTVLLMLVTKSRRGLDHGGSKGAALALRMEAGAEMDGGTAAFRAGVGPGAEAGAELWAGFLGMT